MNPNGLILIAIIASVIHLMIKFNIDTPWLVIAIVALVLHGIYDV